MNDRDHYVECGACGYSRGGRINLRCICDAQKEAVAARLMRLAGNLAIGATLCRAFVDGFEQGFMLSGEGFNGEWAPHLKPDDLKNQALDKASNCGWRPGCGRPANVP